ncbi:MAG TPA: flagellar hook-associated protein FlgK [Actinotalea sp.]|jgi:flagellar hook-associated protein 1 FlgK
MSTFSGLSTALSSLIAQRQALDVSGQNIANANTAGYTRQRADLTSVQALSAPSMFSAQSGTGNGTRVSGITRMGDSFLDTRLRAATSTASFQSARADSLGRLQSTISEPSETSVSAQLQTFWAGWHDVANQPSDQAARQVLLGDAEALVTQISGGYRAVESQWSQMRTETQTLATEVNTTAKAVAQLNEHIRSIQVSGGTPNELVDQRSELITKLSGLVGASAREREDGTVDVMVGGNALVRGVKANEIAVTGSFTMSGAIDLTAPVGLTWAATGTALWLDSGTLASHLADLAPDGSLAAAIGSWNAVATSLATTVNAAHRAGNSLETPPVTGRDFFTFAPGSTPPALGLSVALKDHPEQVAAATPGKGGLDGSNADAIAGLVDAPGGPDRVWRDFVVDLGVRTHAADQRAAVMESARSTAENLQLSSASVDLDEESVNMLAFQRAYEGAARVLTTMDEMLDTLINRTGTVGR